MERKIAKFIGYHTTERGIELHNTNGYIVDTKKIENVMFYPFAPGSPWRVVLARKDFELL